MGFYAQKQILATFFSGFLKISGPENLVFARFFEVPDGLESSGRPGGNISTKFRLNPRYWERVMLF